MEIFPIPITPKEFRTTLLSHGWFDLGPFKVDIKNSTLIRAFKNRHGDGIFKICVKNDQVFCETLFGNDNNVCQVAANCLSLDIDLMGLYSLVAKNSDYGWIIQIGFGRYLRSPNLYEDCIKIISTANQNWSNTKWKFENSWWS